VAPAHRRFEAGSVWALRGGKGHFGVVTALEFTLFPVKSFYGGGLFFPGEHATKVLHTWREWVVDLPTEMSSSVVFLCLPPLPMVPGPLRGRFVMHRRFSSLRPGPTPAGTGTRDRANGAGHYH
jgi:hypothetical protein